MPVQIGRPVSGERYFFGGTFAEYVTTGALGKIAAREGVTLPPLSEVSDAEPMMAWVQENRWVAACPDCRSNAQLLWESALLYLCCCCWNHVVGGTWRRVVFPAARDEIERILAQRPVPTNRNWVGESLDDLRAENVAHNLPPE